MVLAGPQRACGPSPVCELHIPLPALPLQRAWFPSAPPLGQTEVWPGEKGLPELRLMEPFKFKEADEERGVVQIAF